MTDPFTPRIDGDRHVRPRHLRHEGRPRRGADRRPGGRRLGLAGDVVVAAVADEEHASLGIQEALRHV